MGEQIEHLRDFDLQAAAPALLDLDAIKARTNHAYIESSIAWVLIAEVEKLRVENQELRTLAKIGTWHNECRPNRHQAARELEKSQAIINKLADTISDLRAELAARGPVREAVPPRGSVLCEGKLHENQDNSANDSLRGLIRPVLPNWRCDEKGPSDQRDDTGTDRPRVGHDAGERRESGSGQDRDHDSAPLQPVDASQGSAADTTPIAAVREVVTPQSAYLEIETLPEPAARYGVPQSEAFELWWERDGQYIDPDTSDVPWFDSVSAHRLWQRAGGDRFRKRKELCALAFIAATAQSRNYTANAAVEPTEVTFTNGRRVKLRAAEPAAPPSHGSRNERIDLVSVL